jgi:hypothetical protein
MRVTLGAERKRDRAIVRRLNQALRGQGKMLLKRKRVGEWDPALAGLPVAVPLAESGQRNVRFSGNL